MKSIILSLISLLSVACYGAVDIKALELKAAAYAKEAAPITMFILEKNDKEPDSDNIWHCFISHTTTADINSEYSYFEKSCKECLEALSKKEWVKEYTKDHTVNFGFQMMRMSVEHKEALRHALAENDVAAAIKILKDYFKQNGVSLSNDDYFNKFSLFYIAVETGQYDIIIDLILTEKIDFNKADASGITPLGHLINIPYHHFMPELMMFMIERGADINKVYMNSDHQKWYSLAECAAESDNTKILYMLKELYKLPEDQLPEPVKAPSVQKKIMIGDIVSIPKESGTGVVTFRDCLCYTYLDENNKPMTSWLENSRIPVACDYLKLLSAVYEHDNNYLMYLVDYCGKSLDSLDACYALVYAHKTRQADIVQFFKDRGLTIGNEKEEELFQHALTTPDALKAVAEDLSPE